MQVEIVPEELGFSVNIGELLLTECEMVNGFVAPQEEPPHFTRGYGLTFGMSERKAMAMALVDRALQAPDYDEEIAGPAQDEEFVLAHADNVEAAKLRLASEATALCRFPGRTGAAETPATGERTWLTH